MNWRLTRDSLRSGPRGLILMYHRVATPPNDPLRLCTPPALFRRHLELIAQSGLAVPLEHLAREAQGLALSFDDGYAEHLTTVAPLLAEYSLPATFFVTSRRAREFWWDELEALVLGDEQAHWRWRMGMPCPTPAARRYTRLFGQLEKLPGASQAGILAALRSGPSEPRDSHRLLSPRELEELARRPGVSIGCHTVSHERLTLVDQAIRRWELEDSKAALESALNLPISSFAYPFGALNAAVAAGVQEAGFAYACAAHPGLVFCATNPFCLPRCCADALSVRGLGKLLALVSPAPPGSDQARRARSAP